MEGFIRSWTKTPGGTLALVDPLLASYLVIIVDYMLEL
jgi:hypothetical protein